jgi:hypothetical protein
MAYAFPSGNIKASSTTKAKEVEMPYRALVLILSLALLPALSVQADWDLSNATIPVDAIRAGGPPKDGIPALMEPRFVKAEQAYYLGDNDTVIGFAWGGVAKAYPLNIMSWHESVNDRLADHPFLVSW